jgi:hypothetical protein
MTQYPDKSQQIVLAHAAFIRQVVASAGNADGRAELDRLLQGARDNGWGRLVDTLREILAGRRDDDVLRGLDEEDRAIAEAVMRGLQDPATLPDPAARPDATMAAPGLAHMIHAAATGNAQALVLVGNMAEQMGKAGGDMAKLAGRIRPLVNGERDPDRLCKGMGPRGEQLMLGILAELGRLDLH